MLGILKTPNPFISSSFKLFKTHNIYHHSIIVPCYAQTCRKFSQSLVANSRFSELVSKVRESYPIQEITPKELHDSLNNSTKPNIIIDVREKDEQLRGIIPTAVPLPRGVLERDVERKVVSIDEINSETGRNVILYCAGGLRSIMAAESLVRLGYKKENIKSLKGGYDEWKESGFEVMDYDSPKKTIPDAICGASAVYLTIENDGLSPFNNVREMIGRAAESGYISIQGFKFFKALKTEKELSPDDSRKEIDKNINRLKFKFEYPVSEDDVSLYGSLRQILENVDLSNLTWRDPEASMIISDDSFMLKDLDRRQKNTF
ncbi:Rhodanese-like protein [Gigaspora margarita]|uniref:Rhodanese-like protein n=1 Tax=Gigaspora margarita TaxID=4874 RepID=A0A8H4A4C6_GIGMA|nr:Rhodanese-like protein [Gigaspora margarita]